jgi:CheY-like chemotaxis protein
MSKILVVDDDPQSRQLYVALLTPFGHEVLEAQDGSEGLERALRTKPDLVISDILMPTMNGYEFVSALRACPDVAGTPIIFSSATFLDRATRSMGASCGVSLFITKPFDPEKVVEIVQDSLGLKLENALRPHPPQPGSDAIPLLIDAYFEKGEQFNAVSARLAALLDLGMSLARTHSTEELMERAGTAARKIIGARFCGIGILSGSGFQLRCFKFFGADPEVSAQLERREFCGPLFRDIVQERKAQLTFSPFGEPERLDLPACHPPIHSFLGVPWKSGTRCTAGSTSRTSWPRLNSIPRTAGF